MNRTALILILLALAVSGPAALIAGDAGPDYGPPEKLCELENRRIHESSGLAISHRRDNLFWTHNDSGDSPRIFAFDSQGRDWGEFRIPGAGAVDWEDMASFQLDGRPCLLLADVGDNPRRRQSSVLYLVEEPADDTAIVQRILTIEFRYEDGAHNCESVAVDPVERRVLLLAKEPLTAAVYELTLPATLPTGPACRTEQIARQIGRLALPMTTAFDISPDGRRAIALTYGHAYEYARQSGDESWSPAFGRPPREIPMPPRRQGESICYGADGRTIFLTSEHRPTPLWKVPVLTPPP